MLAVFDAYGTLFDVDGAARQAAAEPGAAGWAERWPALSADWRRKQLEYTWLRGLQHRHADFRAVTGQALDWALARHHLTDPALHAQLMALYDRLPAFAEVPAALDRLAAGGWRLAILSNGTPAMLASAVAAAGLAGRLEAVLSVEEVGVFKPAPEVYALVAARTGVAPADTVFVSSNGWDAWSAAAFGMRAVWVNRAGAPEERLPGRPALVLPDLAALPAALGA
jgi:2-haloacid dehalogenase